MTATVLNFSPFAHEISSVEAPKGGKFEEDYCINISILQLSSHIYEVSNTVMKYDQSSKLVLLDMKIVPPTIIKMPVSPWPTIRTRRRAVGSPGPMDWGDLLRLATDTACSCKQKSGDDEREEEVHLALRLALNEDWYRQRSLYIQLVYCHQMRPTLVSTVLQS